MTSGRSSSFTLELLEHDFGRSARNCALVIAGAITEEESKRAGFLVSTKKPAIWIVLPALVRKGGKNSEAVLNYIRTAAPDEQQAIAAAAVGIFRRQRRQLPQVDDRYYYAGW
jgi:hypothetical protein